ncbi:LacI family DNA-binding transcriptional regulator [Phytohabitans kaempferiae]|uniref:LacI family DNA-binding transcriptional regulator n=1 Tax=Phytohabitans kaempferiae TaxID=1620943 RepID=A0ABV6M2T3_9ACTN
MARVAGVSSSTVSHVINNTRYISPSTRKAVLDAIESTGYLADGIARSLRTGTTQSIGLAMSALSNTYFAAFVHAIEKEISRSGFSLVLADTHDDPEREARAVQEILALRVDGMIVAPTNGSVAALDKLAAHNVPTILIDRVPPDPLRRGMDAIGVENAEPTAQLVDHLAEIGHSRIAFVGPNSALSTTRERLEGFREGLRRNGIEADDELITSGGTPENPTPARIAQLFDLEDPPTAIVAGNNEMTISVMQQLRGHGRRVPDDVALVCFDDFEWADLFAPRLTAMAQPADEIGRRAVQMLFERLKDRDLESRVVRLPPTFEHRDSCGPAALHRRHRR